MAIYQYRCCDHGIFEVHKPMGKVDHDERCPECGGPTNRMFSPPTVIYKAGGFYSTRAMGDAKVQDRPEPQER